MIARQPRAGARGKNSERSHECNDVVCFHNRVRCSVCFLIRPFSQGAFIPVYPAAD
jgi:hypothetical protein